MLRRRSNIGSPGASDNPPAGSGLITLAGFMCDRHVGSVDDNKISNEGLAYGRQRYNACEEANTYVHVWAWSLSATATLSVHPRTYPAGRPLGKPSSSSSAHHVSSTPLLACTVGGDGSTTSGTSLHQHRGEAAKAPQLCIFFFARVVHQGII